MSTRTILAVVGALTMVGGARAATAPAGLSPIPATPRPAQPNNRKELYGHILAGVMLNNGIGGQLNGGFYQLDSKSVTCNNPMGCTIDAVTMVQVYGASQAGNKWSICMQVDGNYSNQPNCPYLGTIPTDNYGDTRYTTQYATVVTGVHTVTINVYSDASAIIGGWQTTYNVLVP